MNGYVTRDSAPMLEARSITMDEDFNTIVVRGIPMGYSEDRMIDKLTIHFLRPRNGGGEVLRVLYFSQTPELAFVIFEQSEVATRVLQRAHVLQLGDQSFPLTLSRGERAEVDMPASTTLDMQKFQHHETVRSVLRRYGLKVSQQGSSKLLLEGTFLKLSAARAKLAQLLSEESQSQSSSTKPSPSVHSSGAVPKQKSLSYSDMFFKVNGATGHAGSWSLEMANLSPVSSSSFAPAHNLDMSFQQNGTTKHSRRRSPERAKPSPVSSSSSASTRRPNDSQLGTSRASDSLSRAHCFASPHHDRASFEIDSLTLHFARSFHDNQVQEILKAHCVEMDVQEVESSQVSTVVLHGYKALLAKDKLAEFLMEVQSNLRTQKISLSTMSEDQQWQMSIRIQKFKDEYKVLVKQDGDTLQLVGTSRQSYEMKQRILGGERGRSSFREEGSELVRSQQARRSQSLPRLRRKVTSDPEPSSVVVRGARQAAGDGLVGDVSTQRAGTSDRAVLNDSPRGRSSSETRAKLKEGRASPGLGVNDRAPPASTDATKAKEKPQKNKQPKFLKKLMPQSLKDISGKKLPTWK
ncbi:hypothetical protein GJAV_G00101550 [Gymnothorax javanicus]|nr:hypothetical protein GJAV_G00101550 [Gymnothorax javanicus]